MNKTINPELVLAGAKLAFPEWEWRISHTGRVVTGKSAGIWWPNDRPDVLHFNPLTSGGDAWALERALKKEGWQFGGYTHSGFYAWTNSLRAEDPSDTLLLLKCLSAQTGIPMYLEDKQ